MDETTPRYDLAILREQATEAAAVDGAFVEVDGEELLALVETVEAAEAASAVLDQLEATIRAAAVGIDALIASGRLDFAARRELREIRALLGALKEVARG